MPGQKMKKLTVLVVREQSGEFIKQLISMGATQIIEAEDFPEDNELHTLAKRELIDLNKYHANRSSISVLGTKYTIMLTGWVPIKFESETRNMLSKFLCAWDLGDLTQSEADTAPVELPFKWFFGKYRLGGRKEFDPLVSSEDLSQVLHETAKEETQA